MKVDYCHSPGSDKDEDAYFLGDDIFGVFDGYSSTAELKDPSKERTGRKAAEIAKKVFEKLPKTKSLRSAALEANKQILVMNKKNYGADTSLYSGTTMAVIRFKKTVIEYIQITDSLVFVEYLDRSLVQLTDDQREYIFLQFQYTPTKNPLYSMLQEIKKARKEANVKYGTLNGMHEAEQFFQTGKIDRATVKSIFVVTDGIMLPAPSLDMRVNMDKVRTIYRNMGIKGLLRQVRRLEKQDPMCTQFPRLKMHDDATGIRVFLQ